MKEQNKLLAWVKDHKKVTIILDYKTRKHLMAPLVIMQTVIAKVSDSTPAAVENAIEETETSVDAIEPIKFIVVDSSNIGQISSGVSKHIRNLPEGRIPFIVKVGTAAENGIHFRQNQTGGTDYMKGGAVA